MICWERLTTRGGAIHESDNIPIGQSVPLERQNRLFWLVIAILFVLGIVGSIWNYVIPWQWAQHLTRDLAVAFFVAALLALSVDRLFKAEFSRDAFNAAFSYVLPDELKQEIRRIINYKFLGEKTHMILTLTKIDDQFLKLEIRTERIIKNISSEPEKINNSFALDEWGANIGKSVIKQCTMEFKDKVYRDTKPRADLTEEAIGRVTDEVTIGHNETVKLISIGEEIKSINSEFLIYFEIPTLRPSVDVIIPPGFKHSLDFGVPGVGVVKSEITARYDLDGMVAICWIPERSVIAATERLGVRSQRRQRWLPGDHTRAT